jgi:hypothetical protein
MNDKEYVKPACDLKEVDSNVYAIIGHVSKTIRRAGYPDKAREFSAMAFQKESYDAVIQLAMEFTDVR